MKKSATSRLAIGAATITTLLLAVATPRPAAAENVPAPPRYVPSAGLTATEVTFANGPTTLHGSIVRRADLDTAVRHPGIVLVHGSGIGNRVELTHEAEALAKAGIVSLIYDKRGDYSKFHRDFSAMAGDALAGLRVLRSSDGVDADKVGLWGFSEGGWIAPLAASRSADVKFVITVGASGLNPSRTQAWHLAGRLNRAGIAAATSDALASRSVEVVTGLGAFAAAEYDPIPALNQVRQPVLAIWGERDVVVPPAESAAIFSKQLTASRSVTLRTLPGASHGARVTPDGYQLPGGPVIAGYPDGQLTPGYAGMMSAWVEAVTAGTAPASHSDTPPRQGHDSLPLTPVTWLGFGLFGLLLATLLSWPVAAVIRRLRGHRGAPPGARPARWLTTIGLVTALGSAGYVVFIVVAQGQPGTALLGQPLAWLLLRLLLVGAFVSATLLARSAWRGRAALAGPQRLRVGLLLAGSVMLLPFALSIGLLLP
ncbi:alpha/beta hydrolase family protein [Micromonospora eburnea]|nr:prolyl oligopeptidase family serine peptidase [Micromonospora eburnea]